MRTLGFGDRQLFADFLLVRGNQSKASPSLRVRGAAPCYTLRQSNHLDSLGCVYTTKCWSSRSLKSSWSKAD